MSSRYLLVVRPLYDTKRIFVHTDSRQYHDISPPPNLSFFSNTNGAVTFSLPEIHPSYLSDFGIYFGLVNRKNIRQICDAVVPMPYVLFDVSDLGPILFLDV